VPRKSRKVYRDGKVHVCARLCDSCILRKDEGSITPHLTPGRVEQMLRDATKRQSCIPCHATLDGPQAICRGYYELRDSLEYANATLQIAERLGFVEFMEPPKEGH